MVTLRVRVAGTSPVPVQRSDKGIFDFCCVRLMFQSAWTRRGEHAVGKTKHEPTKSTGKKFAWKVLIFRLANACAPDAEQYHTTELHQQGERG